ncbi:MAG TPA: hypothetical protein VGM88_23490 [Kofleriaceae bacterium]
MVAALTGCLSQDQTGNDPSDVTGSSAPSPTQTPAGSHALDRVHAMSYAASATVQLSILGIDVGVVIDPLELAHIEAVGTDDKGVAHVSASTTSSGSVVAQLILGLDAVDDTASGSAVPQTSRADADFTTANASLLGLVTADAIDVSAWAQDRSETGGDLLIENLVIGGQPIATTNLAPNTTISVDAGVTLTVAGLPLVVPGTFTVVLNEQGIFGGGGTTLTPGYAVNAIHVTGTASVAGVVNLDLDAIIGHAEAETTGSGNQ